MRPLALILLLPTLAPATEPGRRPMPYSFHVATGPERGRQTCFVCETGKRPAAVVFARKTSPELGRLLFALDGLAKDAPADGFRAWCTVLGEGTIGLDALATWATDAGLKAVPVGVFDDPAGPPSYRLSDAEVTVLLFVDAKVRHAHALRAAELTPERVERIAAEARALRP